MPIHWFTWTVSHRWWERPKQLLISNCTGSQHQLFTWKSHVIHFSALFCRWLCRTVRFSPPPFTKGPLRYILARGEEEERDTLCEVSVLPCPAQQNFTTISQRILWSTVASLVVHGSDGQKKIAENGLQTTISSYCMHFQDEVCDIQEAPWILVKMVIILKEGRGGKERNSLATYKELKLFLYSTPFSFYSSSKVILFISW